MSTSFTHFQKNTCCCRTSLILDYSRQASGKAPASRMSSKTSSAGILRAGVRAPIFKVDGERPKDLRAGLRAPGIELSRSTASVLRAGLRAPGIQCSRSTASVLRAELRIPSSPTVKDNGQRPKGRAVCPKTCSFQATLAQHCQNV